MRALGSRHRRAAGRMALRGAVAAGRCGACARTLSCWRSGCGRAASASTVRPRSRRPRRTRRRSSSEASGRSAGASLISVRAFIVHVGQVDFTGEVGGSAAQVCRRAAGHDLPRRPRGQAARHDRGSLLRGRRRERRAARFTTCRPTTCTRGTSAAARHTAARSRTRPPTPSGCTTTSTPASRSCSTCARRSPTAASLDGAGRAATSRHRASTSSSRS